MFFLFETADIATVEGLLVSIPESLGVLAFGVGLAGAAVLTRWFLGKDEASEADKKVGKQA